jgi:omega-amidase
MPQLLVGLLQMDLAWADKAANRAKVERSLRNAPRADLIVLPEMFSTGFSMDTSLAESTDGPTMQWLRALAEGHDAAIVGSFICADAGRVFNRLVFVRPDGGHEAYDKRHLFAFAGEDRHYAAGGQRRIVSWRGWRICPLVCYDLRFPVWSRNSLADGYDLLIYIANWPKVRAKHWEHLLLARAIENQSFVVGVNRVGSDAGGNEHLGGSCAIDALGEVLCHLSDSEGYRVVALDRAQLLATRQRFPFLRDADAFDLD